MARIIKRYNSAGDYVETINPDDAKFALGFMGGCLGGSVSFQKDLRQIWELDEGDRLEFLTAEDTICYTGFVTKPKRGLATPEREYELRKPWDLLSEINLESDLVLGWQSVDHPTVGTVKAAVEYLLENHIEPALTWLTDIETLVTAGADKALGEIRFQAGTDLSVAFQTLAYMASTSSATVATGIDESLQFYFMAVPDTIISTITIGTDAHDAEETPANVAPVTRLVLVGDRILRGDQAGFKAKRTYALAGGSARPATWLHVRGLWREADLDLFKTGYFARHGEPGITVNGLAKYTTTIPKPWEGKFRYDDLARGIQADDYATAVSVEFNFGNEISVDFGLHHDGTTLAGDAYSQSTLDDVTEDIIEEIYTDIPDATDETAPPDDYPREINQETPTIPPTDSADIYTRGYIMCFNAPGGVLYDPSISPAKRIKCHAMIRDNGAALESTNVRFHYKLVADNGSVLTSDYEFGEALQSKDGYTVWASETGYAVSASGNLYVAVRVLLDDDTEYWYPADINVDPTDCQLVTIHDLPGEGGEGGGGTYILNIGWAVARN